MLIRQQPTRVIRLRISRCRVPIGVRGLCERFRPKAVVNLAIPVLPLLDRTLNKSSKEAHIRHTKPDEKRDFRWLFDRLPLIGANQLPALRMLMLPQPEPVLPVQPLSPELFGHRCSF
jgi:hypothetical protein